MVRVIGHREDYTIVYTFPAQIDAGDTPVHNKKFIKKYSARCLICPGNMGDVEFYRLGVIAEKG